MTPEEHIELARNILEVLHERKTTLATAESCTGGLVSAAFVRVPGASDVYQGGAVAYSNKAKSDLLGVPPELIEQHGAVSARTAREMARGAQSTFGADLATSTTGIAGPTGGTPDKPVGTVFCHVSGPNIDKQVDLQLEGDRHEVQDETVIRLLDALHSAITR